MDGEKMPRWALALAWGMAATWLGYTILAVAY